MTSIGLALNFCNKKKHKKKIATRIQLTESNASGDSGQNAEIRIEIPAEAINETTAGRREDRTLCKASIFRYFR